MEIRDFEKKMKYAMDFYDQATEIQHMVHDSIRGFHYLYGYDLYNEREVSNPELASLVERRKRQLLIEMGRVGEYSITYVLLYFHKIALPRTLLPLLGVITNISATSSYTLKKLKSWHFL